MAKAIDPVARVRLQGEVTMDECKHCGEPIDREKLKKKLEHGELPSIVERAVAGSIFCSLLCAMENFVKEGPCRTTE
jgi:hypothetical protein